LPIPIVQGSPAKSSLPAAPLALLLAAEPADVPPVAAPPAAEPAVAPPAGNPLAAPIPSAPPAIAPSGLPVAAVTASLASGWSISILGQVHAGLGVSVSNANSRFASTFQAGVQVDPWDHFGFRVDLGMTTSGVGAGGWDAAELSGAVLVRPIGNQRRVVPYAGVGVQFALLAIYPDSLETPAQGQPRLGGGHLAPTMAVDSNGDMYPNQEEGYGGTPQFKVMPEVTAGALIRLTSRIDLDVAARYVPLNWYGTTYNGFSFIASVCAPF
jgi:hypothetical protein